MGKLAFYFFSKEIAQLEAYRDTLKNESDRAEVQASIDRLKAEEAKRNEA